MILTCPVCATQYRLKDGAIPPEGRTVRCASCKHKWHQDAETELADPGATSAAVHDPSPRAELVDHSLTGDAAIGGPPQPGAGAADAAIGEVPTAAAEDAMIAETPEPEIEPAGYDSAAGDPEQFSSPGTAPTEPARDDDSQADGYATEPVFAAIPAMHDDDEPRRKWLPWIVALILIVVAAAAAFYFLAPPELKARAGIAEAGESKLDVMLETNDRQRLASGNDLLAISGRVINNTDRELAVPPIRAELRDDQNKLVYQWTIAAPARSLAPGKSASFNNAELDVPSGAMKIALRLES
jgi:predicted Zn finger-like uncharacterized protein